MTDAPRTGVPAGADERHPHAEERLGPYEPFDDPVGPHADDLRYALTHDSVELAWHNPSYLFMLVAQFVSLIGTHMSTLALPWFVLTSPGGTPGRMVGVLLATAIPYAAFGLFAGAFVDRFDTKRFMVWLDLARGGITALIPALHLLGVLQYWEILAVAALSSTLSTPYQGARMAIVPDLVGERERDLTLANTALQLSMQLTTVFGPVFAGLLIPAIGNVNVLFVDAATYLVAAALLALGVRKRVKVRLHEAHHILEEVRTGVAFIWNTRLIRIGIIVGTLATLGFAMMVTAALPVFVREVLHEDSDALGWLLGTWGAGASIGMVFYGSIGERWPFPRGLTIASFMTLMVVPLWVPPATAAFTPSLVAFGVSGLFGAPVGIIVNTLLQTGTPPNLRGRVFSAFQALMLVATPVGLAIAGPVLSRWGVMPLMWGTAALFTVTAATLWASRDIRHLEASMADAMETPAT